jgi:two-component system OmpR family response regulator
VRTPVHVLVVEDDPRIAALVERGLREQGCTVEVCGDGDEAYALATTRTYDVLVLDIMLPGRDGLSILRGLRQERHAVPVILLTARSTAHERVTGLGLGADDYLTKPFYVEELIARVHAVTRRAAGQPLSILQAEDLTVNLLTREVRRGETLLDLTTREFSLLELLLRSPGRVYTRTQILEHVWGYDFDPGTNVVDVYIRRVRRKIDQGHDHSLIETVRGVGYRVRETS